MHFFNMDNESMRLEVENGQTRVLPFENCINMLPLHLTLLIRNIKQGLCLFLREYSSFFSPNPLLFYLLSLVSLFVPHKLFHDSEHFEELLALHAKYIQLLREYLAELSASEFFNCSNSSAFAEAPTTRHSPSAVPFTTSCPSSVPSFAGPTRPVLLSEKAEQFFQFSLHSFNMRLNMQQLSRRLLNELSLFNDMTPLIREMFEPDLNI